MSRTPDLQTLDKKIKGGLVVSCQPLDGGPMDDDATVARTAQAAVAGGARALRIEGARRLAVVRRAVPVPIIGIVKRDLPDSPVRITPWLSDVQALADAGADIIAVDGTQRERPESLEKLLLAIRATGALAMADCSNLQDALAAHALGYDIVGTTLSGYTGGDIPDEPDYVLLKTLAQQLPRVMAEGRINRPEQAREAIELGAWAVTVGTAITRTEVVTEWFSGQLPALAES